MLPIVALFVLHRMQDAFALRMVSGGGGFAHSGAMPQNRKDALMNSTYTASEENRLATAAMAEARHLRSLAPAQFWSAVGRWAGSMAGRLARSMVHPGRPGATARRQAK